MTYFITLCLVSIYVACSTGYTLLIKISANRLILFGALNGVTIAAALFLVPLVPMPAPHVFKVLLLSSCAYNAMLYFTSRAYSLVDLSQIYPLTAAVKYIAVIAVAKFIFKENASSIEWLGVMGIAFGILCQINFKDIQGLRISKGVIFAILAGVFGAIQLSSDIYGVRISENPFSFIVWSMFYGLPVTCYALFKYGSEIKGLIKKEAKQIFLGAIFDNVGYAALLFVTYSLKVLHVLPLSNMTIVFSTLVGIYYLKETMARKRIVAALLIFVSIVVMQI